MYETPDIIGDLADVNIAAGLGRRRILEQIASGFRGIIALLTILFILANLGPRVSEPVLALLVIGYLLYFVVTHWIRRQFPRVFGQPVLQAMRAVFGVAVITALLLYVPNANRSALWLAYIFPLLLAGKYNGLWVTLLVVALSLAGLVMSYVVQIGIPFVIRATLFNLPPEFPSAAVWSTTIYLPGQVVALVSLMFIIHVLVRASQTYHEAAYTYDALKQLASMPDSSLSSGDIRDWSPMLVATARRLGAACAIVWRENRASGTLHAIAAVRRSPANEANFELYEPQVGTLDIGTSQRAVARAYRSVQTGSPELAVVDDIAHFVCSADCNTCHAGHVELAYPISSGVGLGAKVPGLISISLPQRSFSSRQIERSKNVLRRSAELAAPYILRDWRERAINELYRLSSSLSAGKNEVEFFDVTLSFLTQIVGLDFATISVIENGLIRTVRATPNVTWAPEAVHSLDASDIQSHIVNIRKALIVRGEHPLLDRQIAEAHEHYKMERIFAPLLDHDREATTPTPLGTIEAGYFDSRSNRITKDQQDLVARAASVLFSGMRNKRLYEAAQDRLKVLERLRELSQEVSELGSLSKIHHALGRCAHDLFGADIVIMWRKIGDVFKLESAWRDGQNWGEYKNNAAAYRTGGAIARLTERRKAHFAPDAKNDVVLVGGPTTRGPTFAREFGVKSCAAMPLFDGSELVGIIWLNYLQPRSFDSEDDRRTHELYANEAVKAVRFALGTERTDNNLRSELGVKLHDDAIQQLTSARSKLATIIERGLTDGIGETLQRDLKMVEHCTNTAAQQLRKFVEEGDLEAAAPIAPLDPQTAHDQLLMRIMERAHEATEHYGMIVEVKLKTDGGWVLGKLEQVVLVARECIINAARHSYGTKVMVELSYESDEFRLTISDDGIGIGLTPDGGIPPKGIGQRVMERAARQMGASITSENRLHGRGTTVTMRVPRRDNEMISS